MTAMISAPCVSKLMFFNCTSIARKPRLDDKEMSQVGIIIIDRKEKEANTEFSY